MAFLIAILGSVAIGILSGICGEMVPSLPPGLDGSSASTSAPATWWHASRSAIHRHSFAILFLALFVGNIGLRLAHFLSTARWRRFAALVVRATRRASRDWFGLLIKNAFVAFVAALVLQCLQSFSLSHFLWEAAKDIAQQVISAVGGPTGSSHASLLERWISWYGANQTKFTFWLLYSAAVCDDLGLPNYKTLTRWAWRRIRKAIQRPKPASA